MEYHDYSTLDPDQLVTCPFDEVHRIRVGRLVRHLVKCQKSPRAKDYVFCKYSHLHVMRPSHYDYHVQHCEMRGTTDREMREGLPHGGGQLELPVTNEQSIWEQNPTENWDDEVKAAGRPTAVFSFSGATTVASLKGTTLGMHHKKPQDLHQPNQQQQQQPWQQPRQQQQQQQPWQQQQPRQQQQQQEPWQQQQQQPRQQDPQQQQQQQQPRQQDPRQQQQQQQQQPRQQDPRQQQQQQQQQQPRQQDPRQQQQQPIPAAHFEDQSRSPSLSGGRGVAADQSPPGVQESNPWSTVPPRARGRGMGVLRKPAPRQPKNRDAE